MALTNDQYQMVMAVVGQVNELFDPESENHRYDLENIDLTQFLIAYIKAGNFLFTRLTGQDKNNLEFTHLANQLIVQDLLEKNEEAA
jgi:hypothetical protein